MSLVPLSAPSKLFLGMGGDASAPAEPTHPQTQLPLWTADAGIAESFIEIFMGHLLSRVGSTMVWVT